MKHVLYLESNPQNVLLVQRVLQAQGCTCHAAAEAQMAWVAAAQHLFDLVLLDVTLPNALDLARQIKQDANLAHTPLVAILPAGDEGLKERAYLAGCEAFLVKPADIRQIRAVVQESLQLNHPALVCEERLSSFIAAY